MLCTSGMAAAGCDRQFQAETGLLNGGRLPVQSPKPSARAWAPDFLVSFSGTVNTKFAACPRQSMRMDTGLPLHRRGQTLSLSHKYQGLAAPSDQQAVWQPSFAGMLGEEQQQSVERAFSITTHQLDLARQQGHQLQVCPGSSAR